MRLRDRGGVYGDDGLVLLYLNFYFISIVGFRGV